jgi:geranylgeranyl diphosphate synthase type II
VEKQLKELAIHEKKPVNLYEPVAYTLESGGKRIRPSLTLMACNLFSDNIEQALMPAVAIEVFHNFTLLHDDVMDHADVRRNRPTVHKRWSESTAILSGDAMLVLAYQYISQAKPEILSSVLDIFSNTALEVCEGQQYDMDFEQRTDVSIDEYLKMIRLKTAVLLAASLKIGALCGGGDQHSSEALYKFGISLGLTFQIQDDWLDVYSDPKIFGKATGGDILSGKKTFLLLSALEKADNKTREHLLALLNRKDIQDEEKIRQVKQVYDQLDVNGMAQQKMEIYYQETMKHLKDLTLPDGSRKEELEKVAAVLLKRSK